MIRILAVVVIFLLTGLLPLAAQTMDDVVYLKNGSIIRGMIIEQVPGKSIKIESGGNIFVYTMDEVERITKEAPPQATRGSSMSAGSFLIRGGVGTDITGGLGFGGGVGFIWTPSYSTTGMEFGVDYFFHSSEEDNDSGNKEKTELGVFTGRVNWLWNYYPSEGGVFFITGVGFVVASIDWREDGPNYRDSFDATSAGNVINLGGGWQSASGFGVRIETPLLFFYNTGGASAFVPTFLVTLAYSFN